MKLFGEGAAKLCHAAAMLLGWRPDEFWNATPAELATVLIADGDVESVTIDELKQRFPNEGFNHG